MDPRRSCVRDHSAMGAGLFMSSFPCLTRMPRSAFVTDLVIDHPVRGVAGVTPGAYRSPTTRPRCTTTTAFVKRRGPDAAPANAWSSASDSLPVIGPTTPGPALGEDDTAGDLPSADSPWKRKASRPGWVGG